LHIPVPKVYAWDSRSADNPVGVEYIIMEKQTGVELSRLWDDMAGIDKFEIIKQVVDYERLFTSTKFTKYGSLYYAKDLPSISNGEPLYVDENGNEVSCSRFAVGPTNGRKFFDDGKGMVDMDRGPCMTLSP
jgi:hypothetical protein